MNIFEYDKWEWKEKGWVILPIFGVVLLALWIALAYFDCEKPFLMSLAVGVCITALYLFLRLFRYLYLFFMGQLWKSKNIFWASSAVKRITDQEKLKKVVKETPFWEVREVAVKKITDQEFLKKVAIMDSDKNVRKAAVAKITDEEFLKNRTINDSDMDVRIESADKLYLLSGNADSLKLIIRELSDNVRSSNNAERLHRIYKKYPISSIRDSISVLNGTIIKDHSDCHLDHPHTDIYEVGSLQSGAPDDIHTDIKEYSDHTDTPEKRFYVE
jgi:hypothetical protein